MSARGLIAGLIAGWNFRMTAFAQDSPRVPLMRTFAGGLRLALLCSALDWLVQVFLEALGREILAGQ